MIAAPAARPQPRPVASRRARPARGVACGVLAVAALALAGCESPSMGDRPSAMAPPMLDAPASSVGPSPDGVPSVDLRGYRIAARVGDVFEIRLPGLPASGHRWTLLDPLPAIVRADGAARRDAGPGDLAGTPAQEVWRFAGVGPGVGTLRFEFRRPTDPPTAPPAQRAIYRVEVR